MKTLLDAVIHIENKVNRLRAIHYLINKLDLYSSFIKLSPEEQEKGNILIMNFVESDQELRKLKLKLALICEDVISLNTLRDLGKEYGICFVYKLSKSQLLDKLRGVK